MDKKLPFLVLIIISFISINALAFESDLKKQHEQCLANLLDGKNQNSPRFKAFIQSFNSATDQERTQICKLLNGNQSATQSKKGPQCKIIVEAINKQVKSEKLSDLYKDILSNETDVKNKACQWANYYLINDYRKVSSTQPKIEYIYSKTFEKSSEKIKEQCKEWKEVLKNSVLVEPDTISFATKSFELAAKYETAQVGSGIQYCQYMSQSFRSLEQYKVGGEYLTHKYDRRVKMHLEKNKTPCELESIYCQYDGMENLIRNLSRERQFYKWQQVQKNATYTKYDKLINEFIFKGSIDALILAQQLMLVRAKEEKEPLEKLMYIDALSRAYYLATDYKKAYTAISEALSLVSKLPESATYQRIFYSLSVGNLLILRKLGKTQEFHRYFAELENYALNKQLRNPIWDMLYFDLGVETGQTNDNVELKNYIEKSSAWWNVNNTSNFSDFWFSKATDQYFPSLLNYKLEFHRNNYFAEQATLKLLYDEINKGPSKGLIQVVTNIQLLMRLVDTYDRHNEYYQALSALNIASEGLLNVFRHDDSAIKYANVEIDRLFTQIIKRRIEIESKTSQGVNAANLLKLAQVGNLLEVNASLFASDKRILEEKNQKLAEFANNQSNFKITLDQFVNDSLSKTNEDIDMLVSRFYQEIVTPKSSLQTLHNEYFFNPYFNDTNLEQLVSNVPNNTAKLFYFIIDDMVNIWSITSEGVLLTQHEIIIEEIRDNIKQITAADVTDTVSDIKDIASYLYLDLMLPVENIIKGKENIIVVPDAELINLPFSLLVNGENQWLIEHYALGYAPRVDVIHEEAMLAKSVGNGFLGLGDPVISTSKNNDNSVRGALAALPETASEIKRISNIFEHSESLLASNLTKENTLNLLQKGFEFIDFATHASWITNQYGLVDSGLMLSPDNNGKQDFLSATEIKQLDLGPATVFLSACSTISGQSKGYEGLTGLAASFFDAGAKAVIVSHWNVYSQSTEEMIVKVFERLKNTDRDLFHAIREVQIDMINSGNPLYGHPRSWAAFSAYTR